MQRFKATVSQKELSKGLAVAKAAGPLLDKDTVKISVEKRHLSFTFSGPSARLEIRVPCEKDQTCHKGMAVIPQKTIDQLARSMKGSVKFSEAAKSIGVENVSDVSIGKFRIPKMDTGAYLGHTPPTLAGPFPVPTDVLKEGMSKVVFAAAEKCDRPSKFPQTGIALKSRAGVLSFQAHQDSFMAIHDEPLPGLAKFDLVMPATVAKLIQKETEDTCNLYLSSTHMRVQTARTTLDACLISDTPRDLRPVINRFQGPTGTWVIKNESKKGVLTAISRTSLFQEKGTERLILDLNPKSVVVLCRDESKGSAKSIFNDTNYIGSNMKLALEPGLLVKILEHTDKEDVEIEFKGPAQLCRVKTKKTTYISMTDYA